MSIIQIFLAVFTLRANYITVEITTFVDIVWTYSTYRLGSLYISLNSPASKTNMFTFCAKMDHLVKFVSNFTIDLKLPVIDGGQRPEDLSEILFDSGCIGIPHNEQDIILKKVFAIVSVNGGWERIPMYFWLHYSWECIWGSGIAVRNLFHALLMIGGIFWRIFYGW